MLLLSCTLLLLSSAVLAAPRIPPECSSDCDRPPGPQMAFMLRGGVNGGPNQGVPIVPMNVPLLMLPPLMMGMFPAMGGGGGGRGGGGGGGRGGGDPIMEARRPNKIRPTKAQHRRMIGKREAEEDFAGIQRPRTIDKTEH
ncbi:hypothetical protein CDEST_15553 [Colletotrichum destructivum]|uniref:Uncharacterized protein n=1 Tax=Colletotrichum destructivum TaxID=34406 RepID=A0AAX4J4L2_9PEZI|nr:hypothetical protein CDEST_15553 [Colletotrichum destructivum]